MYYQQQSNKTGSCSNLVHIPIWFILIPIFVGLLFQLHIDLAFLSLIKSFQKCPSTYQNADISKLIKNILSQIF